LEEVAGDFHVNWTTAVIMLMDNVYCGGGGDWNDLPIGKQLLKHWWYPNYTISSEWDVLQAIVYTLEQSSPIPDVEHVKGHQDCNTAYALLSLQAQLNVDTDTAATLFQDTHGASLYSAPPIDDSGAHLLIADKMVTYNYVKTLRNVYAHPRLFKHIGQCNNWSKLTLSTVGWLSLGMVCKRHHKQQLFVLN
jgi:hypothetical protein